jgi:hypothetical protein
MAFYINKLESPRFDRVNVSKLINLTKREKYFLKNSIYCNEFRKKVYEYTGAIDKVHEYLDKNLIGENDPKFINILLKIINKVKKCYPTKTHILLKLRVNNSYMKNKIRWHWDNNYYRHDEELHSKFIATLCGDQTYGINATQSDRQLLFSLYKDLSDNIITEEEFSKKLDDAFTHKKININYSIIKVGKNHNSLSFRQIHSEPVNIIPNKKRVFISLLYGTEGEILGDNKLT